MQVYEGLTYQLSVSFSEKYPYEAPTVKFETACFHPNVDTAGNICLDILKVSALRPAPPRRRAVPPRLRCCGWVAADRATRCAQDKWSAAFSVRTVLVSLQSLLGGASAVRQQPVCCR